MTVDGPVSMTVTVESQVDATNRMTFATEFVVADTEEAEEKGAQFNGLLRAFSAGFAVDA